MNKPDKGTVFTSSITNTGPVYTSDTTNMDTVPQASIGLDFETWGRAFTRNMKDWTQILANFGLGVAAINSLTN